MIKYTAPSPEFLPANPVPHDLSLKGMKEWRQANPLIYKSKHVFMGVVMQTFPLNQIWKLSKYPEVSKMSPIQLSVFARQLLNQRISPRNLLMFELNEAQRRAVLLELI